jgi:hypothetical protein
VKSIKTLVAILAAIGISASFQAVAKDKAKEKLPEASAELDKAKQEAEMKAEHAKADIEKHADKAKEELSMKQKAMEKKKSK